ncbi:hypothetical protein [Lacimicrobium sp. SS2-24]|uniref:hypothetical protein n=1 Tax=Lacimicrobium sp. SS2-24 TaxID=2005569 RepID=UPI000B4C0D09|nr:hypothetical protein [Lacimicrobium sp. SS2-24]
MSPQNPSNAMPQRPDYVLLAVGIILLFIPLLFVLYDPHVYDKAGLYLRIIAALGAGLVGGSLPGFLHIDLPFARAGGTVAIFLLVYAVNPPKQSADMSSINDGFSAPSPYDSETLADRPETSSSATLPPQQADHQEGRGPASVPVEPVATSPITRWQTVLGTSWVKPSDWLGRHFFLTISDGLYVWPVEIDSADKKARFIVNTSHTSRTSGTLVLDRVWLREGQNEIFEYQDTQYRLTLVDIQQAGTLPTDATYIKVERQVRGGDEF